jgi:hypothetical protein
MKPRNTGFNPQPLVLGDHWLAGTERSIETLKGREVLQADGQWTAFLPEGERQFILNKFDTQACVTFGWLNAIEIYNRRKYGRTENFSDRFIAKASNTKPSGNDPHAVAETIRLLGMPLESDYPFTADLDTWEKFYAVIPRWLYTVATKWIAEFDFSHQYVAPSAASLKEQLRYSPIPLAIFAYARDEQGMYYHPEGAQPNHEVVLVGYQEGRWWLIYDSYDLDQTGNLLKTVRWDMPFVYAKSFTIDRQIVQESAWQKFLNWFAQLFPQTVADASQALQEPITEEQPPKPTPTPPQPKYRWDTPTNVSHSIRVICDEERMSLEQKNTMWATIKAESGFNTKAVNYNRRKDGSIASTDYGLCQWNDYYHGSEISPDEAVDDPEKAVRLMCAYWKRGQRDLWIAYKSGSYKKYL